MCFYFQIRDLGVTFYKKIMANCLFCLYTFHFLRLKQKMDSLLFLI